MQNKTLRITIFSNIELEAARQQLIGIFRYMREKSRRWIVTMGEAEQSDACITNDRKTKEAMRFLSLPVPIVAIDPPPGLLNSRTNRITCVSLDNRRIGELGARHFLKAANFRSFAFVHDQDQQYWSAERAKAFADALRTEGKTCCIHTPEPNALPLVGFLRELPKPAAVMCACDRRSIDVLDACKVAGLSVPGEVSILGVDNDGFYCEYSNPTLSSVEIDFEAEGYRAAAELDRLLSNRRPPAAKTVRLEPKTIVVRHSTQGPVPAATLIERALAYIRRNYTGNVTADSVALAMGVSRRLLDLRFQQLQNTTVGETILALRLAKVEKLLATTELKIGLIAQVAGFASANYLTQVFKRRHGLSMRDWRTRHAANPRDRGPMGS